MKILVALSVMRVAKPETFLQWGKNLTWETPWAEGAITCEEATIGDDKKDHTKDVWQWTPDQAQQTDWALQGSRLWYLVVAHTLVISYWIESSQIKIFESFFELNFPGKQIIEYFFELNIPEKYYIE